MNQRDDLLTFSPKSVRPRYRLTREWVKGQREAEDPEVERSRGGGPREAPCLWSIPAPSSLTVGTKGPL